MLDTHTSEHGYTECYVPYIVNAATMTGTGQLPKFEDDLFWVTKRRRARRIAHVPHSDCRSSAHEHGARPDPACGNALPLKLTAHTPSFRSEAGSYGKDTRGMIRVHQFDKVELVQIVNPEVSNDALEELTVGHAEAILRKLELPYRVLQLCAPGTSSPGVSQDVRPRGVASGPTELP